MHMAEEKKQIFLNTHTHTHPCRSRSWKSVSEVSRGRGCLLEIPLYHWQDRRLLNVQVNEWRGGRGSYHELMSGWWVLTEGVLTMSRWAAGEIRGSGSYHELMTNWRFLPWADGYVGSYHEVEGLLLRADEWMAVCTCRIAGSYQIWLQIGSIILEL